MTRCKDWKMKPTDTVWPVRRKFRQSVFLQFPGLPTVSVARCRLKVQGTRRTPMLYRKWRHDNERVRSFAPLTSLSAPYFHDGGSLAGKDSSEASSISIVFPS